MSLLLLLAGAGPQVDQPPPGRNCRWHPGRRRAPSARGSTIPTAADRRDDEEAIAIVLMLLER
jgi:hypothetical protein